MEERWKKDLRRAGGDVTDVLSPEEERRLEDAQQLNDKTEDGESCLDRVIWPSRRPHCEMGNDANRERSAPETMTGFSRGPASGHLTPDLASFGIFGWGRL
jgi:hypothetical protein